MRVTSVSGLDGAIVSAAKTLVGIRVKILRIVRTYGCFMRGCLEKGIECIKGRGLLYRSSGKGDRCVRGFPRNRPFLEKIRWAHWEHRSLLSILFLIGDNRPRYDFLAMQRFL